MMPLSESAFIELENRLADWQLRLRLRDALAWSLRGLAAGLALGLVPALLARLRPLLTTQALIALSAGLALLGLGLALALAYFWPRPRLASARYFDRLFGLAERTSTALELAARPDAAPEWLRRDQWADAAAAARQVDPRQRLRFTVERREAAAPILVAAVLALVLYMPNPQQSILAQQIAVDQAIAEQIEALEAALADIEDNPALSEEQKQELAEPLEDALAQLKEGDLTQEQAVEILTETQQRLDAQTDPNAQAQAEALQDAGQTLSEDPNTQAAGEALAQGDLDAAAEALSDMDLSQLTPEEMAALAEQLQAAAEQLADTNPEVAAQLQAAADALEAGDAAAAEAALEAAAQAIAQTASGAAAAEAASEAAAQVAEAQDAVAQAGSGQGQSGNQGQGQGQEQGQGQGQGEGQGEGNGQGQGQGSGQGQGQGEGQGSGAGRGEGTGQGQGGTAGTDPIGQENGPGDGGEKAYEEIYSPQHLGGEGGQDVTVGSGGDPSGEVVGEGPTNPDEAGDVTVPYDQVYADYLNSVYEAVGSGDYPLDLADVIRQYFTSLQP